MKKPRILFVLKCHFSRLTGGAEVKAWMLATELVKRGWDVHYASEMNIVSQPNPLEGVTLHGLPENPSYWTGNRLPLRKLMQELQPDVVYNRVLDMYSLHAMEEAPPHALTVWAVSSDQEGAIGPVLVNYWKTMPAYLFFKRLPVYIHWARCAKRGAKKAKFVISQYRQQQEILQERGIRSEVIPSWQSAVPETECQTHQDEPMLLWVGSLKKLKQPELFIDLARRLQDVAATFVIVGEAQEGGWKDMALAAEKELSNFKYRGFVPPQQVEQLFGQAHVHIKTSVFEGFPGTFIQAWFHRVPVVSLKVDPDELLSKHHLGFCVNTMDEMETVARDLLANPAKRREIGQRARDFALREYDLEANITKFEKLLEARGVTLPERQL